MIPVEVAFLKSPSTSWQPKAPGHLVHEKSPMGEKKAWALPTYQYPGKFAKLLSDLPVSISRASGFSIWGAAALYVLLFFLHLSLALVSHSLFFFPLLSAHSNFLVHAGRTKHVYYTLKGERDQNIQIFLLLAEVSELHTS